MLELFTLVQAQSEGGLPPKVEYFLYALVAGKAASRVCVDELLELVYAPRLQLLKLLLQVGILTDDASLELRYFSVQGLDLVIQFKLHPSVS